jgi:23S rRNA pseudouridine1911/1915/1917 synthase
VRRDGQPITSGSAKAQAGLYAVVMPPVVAATPQPEAIPLTVLFEDADLSVSDKAPGMAAHPAPGCETGTRVNALLAHCGDSLSGIGGVARPGIVHRLDKDTSGVMVAAKSDRAHAGLSALFATHDIERTYIALTRGAPTPEKGRIQTLIGRSPHDRKKMAVLKGGGREAITDYVVQKTFGQPAKASGAPMAARVACTLHTGRTHQIRVHLASRGSPLLGDPVYGSGSPAIPVRAAVAEVGLTRQALHAAVLGFVHPVTGQALRFETAPPEDMQRLEALLAEL